MNTVTRFTSAQEPTNGNGSLSVYRPTRNHPTEPKALSLANAESGVTLYVGQELELDLGSTDWSLRVRDEQLLSEVTPSTFRAVARGKTRIYATRDAAPEETRTAGTSRKLFVEIPVRVD